MSLAAAAASNGVVQHQYDDGADHGDEHRIEIKAGDALSSEGAEYEAADQSADNAEHDVPNAAFAAFVDYHAGNKAGDQTKHDPAEDGHVCFPASLRHH